MARNDMRLSLDFVDHRKTKKLQRRLGAAAVLALITLWSRAGDRRTDGDLSGMSNEDIAIDAGWDGDPDVFVRELVDVGWLDGESGAYRIHDWDEEQPWLSGAEERANKARHAALVKAGKADPKKWQERAVLDPGKSEIEQCSNGQKPVSSSAPSPCPSPNPTPVPSPLPDRGIAHARDLGPSLDPAGEVVAEMVDDGALGGAGLPGAADGESAAGAGATERPRGPAGVPKGPALPYTDAELEAIAAELPTGSNPLTALEAIKSWLQREQELPAWVPADWSKREPAQRAAWAAEAIRRAVADGKKPADVLRCAARHIARAVHDGFDLIDEGWQPRGKITVLGPTGPVTSAPGRPMSNQQRTMAVLYAAAAEGAG